MTDKQKLNDFSDDILCYTEDGRLTGDPDGIRYNWPDFIKKFKTLGRPLTEEEAEEFIIKSCIDYKHEEKLKK